MAKPSRNTIILGGLAVVAALGWLTWNRLQPAGLPTGFTSANGRIEATEVDIAALTGGRIAAINAAEGDLVKAGDVLVQMDVVQLNAQKRQSDARPDRERARREDRRRREDAEHAQERPQHRREPGHELRFGEGEHAVDAGRAARAPSAESTHLRRSCTRR